MTPRECWTTATRLSRYTALLVVLALLSVRPAIAGPPDPGTLTVTKTADTADGACDGDCSLREAIIAANVTAGRQTVSIPAGVYTLSITGRGEDAAATGDLDITDGVEIVGAGAATTIIDGGGIDRIFHIPGGTGDSDPVVDVHITGVTIQHGFFDGSQDTGGGGAILTSSGLTLIDSVVENNLAEGGDGGGIVNQRYLTLLNSTVSNNVASHGDGGGIVNHGPMGMQSSTISGNRAVGGGSGGGLVDYYGFDAIRDSTISGNFAEGNGGGIWGAADAYEAYFNVTFDGNSTNGSGGASYSDGPTMWLYNSTITNNTADADKNGLGAAGAITNGMYGFVELYDTIIAGNAEAGVLSDCGDPSAPAKYNFYSNAGNLIQVIPDGCVITGERTSDLPAGTDPKLGPLANNGGPTLTRALLPGSAAIDAGQPSCPDHDQRGEPRPEDGNGDGVSECDIGAYEAPTIPFSPTPALRMLRWGDNNCSGSVEAEDAILALRFKAGIPVSIRDCPPIAWVVDVFRGSPHLWADVDCDGTVSLLDSLAILRNLVARELIPPSEHCPVIRDEVAISWTPG